MPRSRDAPASARHDEEFRDGASIQRVLAEAHGARRHTHGYDQAALRRDYQIFREEVERAVRRRLRAGIPDVEVAVGVLLGHIDRAEAISLRAWHRANSETNDATRRRA